MTNGTLFSILFLVFVFTGSFGQKLWSLSDCLQYAQENNLQVKQAEIDSKITESRLDQSKFQLLPDLSVSGADRVSYGQSVIPITNELAVTRTRSSSFQANAQFDLFQGFQNINSIRRNTADFMASKYDVEKMRNDITIQVTNAYLLILFNMEIAEMALEQTKVTAMQIERIDKLVQSGSLPKGNLLELQAQLADEELQLINAENQIRLSHLNLLQLLQLEGDYELEILKPLFDSASLAMEKKPASEIFSTSLTLMPQIKSAELKLKSSDINLSVMRAGRSPVLSLGGNYGTGYTENNPAAYFDQLLDNNFRSFGVSLFIPIFSRNTIQQSIIQARLQQERARNNLELIKNDLRRNVENAYADAEAAFKSYHANMKSLIALNESFKYAEKRFDAGLINSVEYNTNKNNLRRAESNLSRSKYDYIFKRKILDFFQGREISF